MNKNDQSWEGAVKVDAAGLKNQKIKTESTARRFWNQKTQAIIPYVPGEQSPNPNLIKLNTNENPYPPAAEVVKALKEFNYEKLKLYPDPEAKKLCSAAAAYYGIDSSMVFAGNGSDEVLSFAFAAFFAAKTRPVIFPDISYSFYPVYARYFDLDWRTIALDEHLAIRTDDYCQVGSDVILANPNAPTGSALSLLEIEEIVKADLDRLVIIDEAYVDFGAETAVPLVESYDNLLVIQTLSKSRALAGLRIGLAFGDPQLVKGLERIRDSVNSYTVDCLAQTAGAAAFEAGAWFEQTRQKIIASRKYTANALEQLGFLLLPSQTNFLFVTHPRYGGALLARKLREKDVLVRHFNLPRISDYLRISIGTQAQMEILVDILSKIIDY